LFYSVHCDAFYTDTKLLLTDILAKEEFNLNFLPMLSEFTGTSSSYIIILLYVETGDSYFLKRVIRNRYRYLFFAFLG
jgi:hypothetical protein